MNNLNKKNYILPVIIFLTGIISRLPFLEKMQSHWDGPEYTIAIVNYSLQNDTPSVPGYPIYIAFGKFFHLFFPDPHISILLVSVLSSGFGAVIFYLLGKRMFNKIVGIIAAGLFITGPTLYYFGVTANPYGVLPITACALALVVFEIKRKKQYGVILGLIYAFVIGFRPQDGLFLTPLFLYGVFLLNKKNKIQCILFAFLGTLLWITPLLYSAGGIKEYFNLLNKYSETALPSFRISYLSRVWFIIAKGLFLSFTFANLFLLYYIKDLIIFLKSKNKLKLVQKSDYILIFSLWIFPALLFNMFVRSDHAAHQMTYISAFLMLISYAIWKIFKDEKIILLIAIIFIYSFNLFTFFRDRDPEMIKPYIPQSYHNSEIRKNNIRLKSKINYIEKKFDSKNTYLVTRESAWYTYSYYLKTYPTVVLFGLDNINATSDYLHTRIDAQNWQLRWGKDSDFIVEIPKNIKTVVFVDDDARKWIRNKSVQTKQVDANGFVTSMSVDPGSSIHYDYHFIEVK